MRVPAESCRSRSNIIAKVTAPQTWLARLGHTQQIHRQAVGMAMAFRCRPTAGAGLAPADIIRVSSGTVATTTTVAAGRIGTDTEERGAESLEHGVNKGNSTLPALRSTLAYRCRP